MSNKQRKPLDQMHLPSLIQILDDRYFTVFLKLLFFCRNYTLHKFGFLESQRLKT